MQTVPSASSLAMSPAMEAHTKWVRHQEQLNKRNDDIMLRTKQDKDKAAQSLEEWLSALEVPRLREPSTTPTPALDRWLREHGGSGYEEPPAEAPATRSDSEGVDSPTRSGATERRQRLFEQASSLEQRANQVVIPDKYVASYSDIRALESLHTKERCPSCGLWRSKEGSCTHCASRPNRMQARLAQAKQIADELKGTALRETRSAVGLGRIVMADYRSTSSPARPLDDIHDKEKCASCGMWCRKGSECRHCVTRPNRAQARRAQARNPQPKLVYRTIEHFHPPTSGIWAEQASRASLATGTRTGGGLGGGGNVSSRPSLARPLSAPLLVPRMSRLPSEDELGTPGLCERRVTASPRGFAHTREMLELLQFARSLKCKA